MHRIAPRQVARRSIPVAITAASAAAAWVVLTVGSLALSPWGPRNRASALVFFAGSAAVHFPVRSKRYVTEMAASAGGSAISVRPGVSLMGLPTASV